MINIQEFAKQLSMDIAPSNLVEPHDLKKYWRKYGARELQKVFESGMKVKYDTEIDWLAISDHKKQLWYESINNFKQTV